MDAPFIDQYQAQKIQPPSAPSESGCCGSRRGIVCALLKGLVINANRRLPAITPSRKSNTQRTIKTRGTLFAERPGILLRCIFCLLNLHSTIDESPRQPENCCRDYFLPPLCVMTSIHPISLPSLAHGLYRPPHECPDWPPQAIFLYFDGHFS